PERSEHNQLRERAANAGSRMRLAGRRGGAYSETCPNSSTQGSFSGSENKSAETPPKGDAVTVRFVMVGGFLGAGKTTTIVRLARHYRAQGKRVGVVTNDQAHDLVDTNALRAQGLAVEEVPGACFCCRFDDLVGRVGALQTSERPDVI